MCVYAYVFTCMSVMANVWWPEDNLWGSVVFFHYIGLMGYIQNI